jgi:hypothetical protein
MNVGHLARGGLALGAVLGRWLIGARIRWSLYRACRCNFRNHNLTRVNGSALSLWGTKLPEGHIG